MEMRSRHAAGRAHASHQLARRHRVPFADVDAREMREHRKQPESVVDDDGVSGHQRGDRHSTKNGQGKIPRSDDGGDPSRHVARLDSGCTVNLTVGLTVKF